MSRPSINLIRRRDGDALGIAVGTLLAIRDAEARGEHDRARQILDDLLAAATAYEAHLQDDEPTTSGDDRP